MSEKTEQPTSKKLRDARNKGQVANSKDVVSTALLIVIFVYFMATMPSLVEHLSAFILLPAQFHGTDFNEAMPEMLGASVGIMTQLILPLLGLVVATGVAANYFQIGALFVMEPIKPELKKLNPVDKAKQIFSMKNLMSFLISVIKVTFLVILLTIVIRDAIPALIQIPYSGIDGVLRLLGRILLQVAIFTMVAYLVIAIADFAFQRWQHTKGIDDDQR